MEIYRSKKFIKAYKKLSKRDKILVNQAINDFVKNPFDPKLKNHALKGKMKEQRTFSAAHDLRVIYREEDGHIIIFMLDVGKHAQVY